MDEIGQEILAAPNFPTALMGPHMTPDDIGWYRTVREMVYEGYSLNAATLAAGDKYPGQGT
jgi:hypothetical protein